MIPFNIRKFPLDTCSTSDLQFRNQDALQNTSSHIYSGDPTTSPYSLPQSHLILFYEHIRQRDQSSPITTQSLSPASGEMAAPPNGSRQGSGGRIAHSVLEVGMRHFIVTCSMRREKLLMI